MLFASTAAVNSIESNCKRYYAHAEITEVAKELAELSDDELIKEYKDVGITMKIDTVEW